MTRAFAIRSPDGWIGIWPSRETADLVLPKVKKGEIVEMAEVGSSKAALEAFDEAAQRHAWYSREGVGSEIEEAKADYDRTKAVLLAALTVSGTSKEAGK